MTNTIANVKLISIFEAAETYTGITKDILVNVLSTGVFVNDHNDDIVTLQGNKMALLILEGTNGMQFVCPAYRNNAFCMNPLYLRAKTGNLHLSTSSVAGTLYASKDMNHLVSLCDRYNEQSICGPKIKAVIEL